MVKYSVVIPTYNSKAPLKNILEAFNYQQGFGRGDYEVIVVDDGSSDNTYDFIKGVNRNYNMEYIYIPRDENSSRARTRNRGWTAAKGEIIVFLDGDMLVRRNYLYEIRRCLEMSDQLAVTGMRIMAPEIPFESVSDGSVYEKYNFDGENFGLAELRHYILNDLSYNYAYLRYPWFLAFSGNIGLHKKWLEKVGGFDEYFKSWGHEDVELGYRLYNAGVKVIINSKMEAIHQHHESCLTQKDGIKYAQNSIYFVDKHEGIFGVPRENAIDVLSGRKLIDLALQKRHCGEKHVIDFKIREELDAVKQQIIEFSDMQGLEIIVNDYIEDTDLDIWIQLLGVRNSIPLYFPVSKKFKQEIDLMKSMRFR